MQLSAKSSLLLLPLALGLVNAQSYNGTGILFYFNPGLGACGHNNTADQIVVSVSNSTFNNYPGHTTDPNNNPICQHNVTISYNGTTVTAPVVDYCISCPDPYVGLSPAGFEEYAPIDQGVVYNVTWEVD
ncbi:hypothetical protein WOLCODRAFT_156377 [Wolfiporia cocos MD-104 SS10]|uniref:RlpA-like protein double-psi beta-barrel domain-containing protein n=1 Tax=Wolfiporia cocos (strain MD-104) TaxID=742152 RepID=A0A2H3J0B2_WOLCO|nr:hypothetical protein WOLCODRAFT_156377 [Wolfiporia cocos MD-104 SS10]